QLDLKEEIGSPDGPIIAHLRRNAGYLRPDAWSNSLTFVALILLGFVINLLLVMPLLIILSIILGLVVRSVPDFPEHLTDIIVIGAVVFAGWAAVYAVVISTVSWGKQSEQSDAPRSYRRGMLFLTILMLIYLGCIVFISIQKPAIEFVYGQPSKEML